MQTNSNVEFNLGKFNVPTIAGILAIIGMLLNMTNSRTEMDTTTGLRLTAIESGLASAKVENTARFVNVETRQSKLEQLEYKVQANENRIDATDGRLDRQSDAIGALGKGIEGVSSDLKLLTQRLEISVPLKKTESVLPFGQTPSELATK